MRRTFAILMSALALAFVSTASRSSAAEPTDKAPTKAELEKQFADSLTGATMVGHYVTGKLEKGKSAGRSLRACQSLEGQGRHVAVRPRIQVEGQDLTLPIPLTVLWAGNTPVITLDETSIPGLGTFSARVLIHGHNYAGTWSHGNEGGQMFGRIEKTAAK